MVGDVTYLLIALIITAYCGVSFASSEESLEEMSTEEAARYRSMCFNRTGSYKGYDKFNPSHISDVLKCANDAVNTSDDNVEQWGCIALTKSTAMECFSGALEGIAMCMGVSDVNAATAVLMQIVRNVLQHMCKYKLATLTGPVFNECEMQYREEFAACHTLEMGPFNLPRVTQFSDDDCRQVLETRVCREKVMKPCAGHEGTSSLEVMEGLWSPMIDANNCEQRVTIANTVNDVIIDRD